MSFKDWFQRNSLTNTMANEPPVPLKACTWNCRGINAHRNELDLFLAEENISILMLQETFLRPHHRFHLKGYTTYRKDRPDGPKGGVALCIKSNLCSVATPMDTDIEAVAADFYHQGVHLRAVSVYKPPPKGLLPQDLQRLLAQNNTLLGGDFNSKHPALGQ